MIYLNAIKFLVESIIADFLSRIGFLWMVIKGREETPLKYRLNSQRIPREEKLEFIQRNKGLFREAEIEEALSRRRPRHRKITLARRLIIHYAREEFGYSDKTTDHDILSVFMRIYKTTV